MRYSTTPRTLPYTQLRLNHILCWNRPFEKGSFPHASSIPIHTGNMHMDTKVNFSGSYDRGWDGRARLTADFSFGQ
ncbi:hypothetical protein LENED_010789 [Lentinula edodes]|uniref:Uncharacterized protein n=1 Tax=Lentinula edodes TaxID=5353 RepID=A0A1Q3ENF1_LENED|nr:hypothetical protein LENED_010789 [Lentinula edodes]